ncbi:MAG TPA: 50S ribosomal protein L33 [Candidatus Pacearchaeota archaeon]|nr:50S ribosomal protein L33 [Candidatus Pacearchaeota archaeon]
MASTKKKKRVRLVCKDCKKSVYFTTKSKGVEDKIELSKFCKFCKKHTTHKEAKK